MFSPIESYILNNIVTGNTYNYLNVIHFCDFERFILIFISPSYWKSWCADNFKQRLLSYTVNLGNILRMS